MAEAELDSPKPNPKQVEADCPRASLLSNLIRLIFPDAQLVPKGLELVRQKTLGHPIYDIIGYRYFLEAKFPSNDTVPNEVVLNIDMY